MTEGTDELYSLLVPMMLVASVAFLLTRGVTIYEAQVPGRVDSPAHVGDFQVDILEQLAVRDLVDADEVVLTGTTTVNIHALGGRLPGRWRCRGSPLPASSP